MSKMLKLERNLEHGCLKTLFDYCFDISTYFSFTKRKFHTKNYEYRNFLQKLSPYYVKTILKSHWFCYYVPKTDPFEICLFIAESYAKPILEEHIDNLFQYERCPDGTLGNIKNLPEDLCFFMQNELLLGTISHEGICYAYPPSEQISDSLKKLGDWQEVDYIKEEHITINV